VGVFNVQTQRPAAQPS